MTFNGVLAPILVLMLEMVPGPLWSRVHWQTWHWTLMREAMLVWEECTFIDWTCVQYLVPTTVLVRCQNFAGKVVDLQSSQQKFTRPSTCWSTESLIHICFAIHIIISPLHSECTYGKCIKGPESSEIYAHQSNYGMSTLQWGGGGYFYFAFIYILKCTWHQCNCNSNMKV